MNGEKRIRGNQNRTSLRVLLILQGAVFLYSINTVCGKYASAAAPFSVPFFAWLFAEVFFLGVYALIWQQAIKKIDIGVAYAGKAVGLVWALLWSVVLFAERVTLPKVCALLLIIAGTVLMNAGNRTEEAEDGQDGAGRGKEEAP
ncbi:MAG: transporter [Lachnospiraceae bacterium]|nr:transporter [Lachnospiraceae bacterium]